MERLAVGGSISVCDAACSGKPVDYFGLAYDSTVSVFCSCFEGTVIVHYCGRNKPWKNKYIGALDIFYEDAEAYLNSLR